MAKDRPDLSRGTTSPQATGPYQVSPRFSTRVGWCYAQANAARWGLSEEKFAAALQRSAEKTTAAGSLAPEKLDDYLGSLHLEDLALAAACLDNCEACDLADSLFTDLYGLADSPGRERSLFRYFHGRSSLKTWLRAVLAQRQIDMIRAGRRFESLDDEDSRASAANIPAHVSPHSADPHRGRYVSLFVRALQAALADLEPRDDQRLRLYYAKQLTLAEIGRQLGEHESSVSRNLDRIRLVLRRAIEQTLRDGCLAVNGSGCEPGLSDAQIALCFEYAAADTPFDLEQLLQRRGPASPTQGKSEL